MNVEKAVLDGLRDYLGTEMTDIAKTYAGFPEPNKTLKMPSLSVLVTGTPERVNVMPYIHKETENVGDATKLDVQYATAMLNISIQLDIWASYKAERGDLLDSLKAAMNKAFIANPDTHTGLRLTLTDYHNIIASYDMVGYTYIEGGYESQSSENRVKVNLVCSLYEIVEKTMPKLRTAEVRQGVGITSEETDDTEDITIY